MTYYVIDLVDFMVKACEGTSMQYDEKVLWKNCEETSTNVITLEIYK